MVLVRASRIADVRRVTLVRGRLRKRKIKHVKPVAEKWCLVELINAYLFGLVALLCRCLPRQRECACLPDALPHGS